MRLDELDSYNELARRIKRLPVLLRVGDLAKVSAAIDGLRALPFPPGYLDETIADMLMVLQGNEQSPTNVYLAFYGVGEVASHIKAGISRNVRKRLSGIKTGNPLPLLWAFSYPVKTRDDALRVEQAILSHLSAMKVHGEWVQVPGLSLQASEAIVDSLAEVAASCLDCPVAFRRV